MGNILKGDEGMKIDTCYYCKGKLTEKEIKEFWEGQRCCNGMDCNCRGLPIDPPCCTKCGLPKENKNERES